MKPLTESLTNFLTMLCSLRQGERSYQAYPSIAAHAVLGGALVGRGLARVVKHRDHCRSYVATAAGREVLDSMLAGRYSPADDLDAIRGLLPRAAREALEGQ